MDNIQINIPPYAPGLTILRASLKVAQIRAWSLGVGARGKNLIDNVTGLDVLFKHALVKESGFSLTESERESITKDASKELASILRKWRKSVNSDKLTHAQTVEMFSQCAPLWREIAAANWEIIAPRVAQSKKDAAEVILSVVQEYRELLPEEVRNLDSDRSILMRLTPTMLSETGENSLFLAVRLNDRKVPWYQGCEAVLDALASDQ